MSGAEFDRAAAADLMRRIESNAIEDDDADLESTDMLYAAIAEIDRLTRDYEARATKLRAAFETDDPAEIIATMEMVIADRDKLQGERDRMRVVVDAVGDWNDAHPARPERLTGCGFEWLCPACLDPDCGAP